jgi:MurNAc alpha-1-phosphate uridylyltransferase
MRPITDHLPKPMVEIAGRSMLDRALDALAAVGTHEVIVNTHHLGHIIAAHLAGRRQPSVRLSPEPDLLETGGGIARALPHLGDAPFFVVNGDVVWWDGDRPALRRLADAWDEGAMDALLLLQPVAGAIGYRGPGDFRLGADGRLRRRGAEPAPLLFAGLQVVSPRLFDGSPAGAFSLNVLYDRAIEGRRLFGIVHDGGWCHVGTPDDIPPATACLRAAAIAAAAARP